MDWPVFEREEYMGNKTDLFNPLSLSCCGLPGLPKPVGGESFNNTDGMMYSAIYPVSFFLMPLMKRLTQTGT